MQVGWHWEGHDLYKSKQVRDKQIARILGQAPTIAAAAYLRLAGRPPVLPLNTLSYSENLLYMLDSLGNRAYKPNPRLARVLDALFILHAEHEMNCSTAAARHLASSGVDVYTALAGALGALYGPLHGGANEAVLKMLNEIGTVENIPEFIEGVKNKKRKMSGFCHRRRPPRRCRHCHRCRHPPHCSCCCHCHRCLLHSKNAGVMVAIVVVATVLIGAYVPMVSHLSLS